jgi:hypothetical protein
MQQAEAFNLFVSFGGRVPDPSLGTDVDVVACCSGAAAIVLHAALYWLSSYERFTLLLLLLFVGAPTLQESVTQKY